MTRALSLAAEGVAHAFPKSGFSLEVERVEVPAGEVLALLGPSGSGKSTLLEVLGLLTKPDRGTVLLDGAAVGVGDRAARLKMAAVFQRPWLFKGSVGENVGYGLSARGIGRTQRAPLVAASLERVGLAGYEKRSALALSGGEAQRVSLARALVVEPRVLLLDEPLASLDPLLKRHLTRDFASILRDAGVTVVYVTHDQDEALVVADRIAVMNRGRIVACGAAEEVTGLPADGWTAAFLGVQEPTAGTVVRSASGLVTIEAAGALIDASGSASVGDAVLFAVRPEDVLIFSDAAELPITSARNRMRAMVASIEPRGATLHVALEAGGVRLASSVSRAACAELGLAAGTEVLAVFKASAVRWRLQEEPAS